MLVEKSFDTGEVVLNYAEGPDNGSPLLLIHGFTRWWKYFQPIIPELSKNFHIFALDLRGHGKSGRAKGHYTLRDYSRDVTAVLENLIQQPTILFGHSLGGWVSLMVASKKPKAVKALIIGDSPLNLKDFSERLKGYFFDWLTIRKEYSMKTFEELLTELDAESAERFSLVDPDVFRLWIEGCEDASAFEKLFEGYDISELLSSIDCPVLLLQGKGVLPNKDVEYAKSVLPDVIHVYFKDYGHYLGLDTGDIERLLESLTTFLEPLR